MDTPPTSLQSPYKGPDVELGDKVRASQQSAKNCNCTSGLMVHSNSHSRFLHFLGGLCGMEITVLLLLTVPLTVASPLRLTQRSDADTVLSGDTVQASGVKISEDTREERVPAMVPFHSEDDRTGLDLLKHNMAVRLRPRRSPQSGCQLGTCQLHNLANTLYTLSKTNGKEESKKANDPQGYGR